MRMPYRLKKVDLSSITGPYQLFGLSLLVIEGLLGYWLFRAQSALERGFTGLVMLLTFLGLVYAVIRITQGSRPGVETSVKPPRGEATEAEIASPAPETISAPDRTYLINLPPEGWRVRELSLADWITEGIGIKDSVTKAKLLGSAEQRREILVFEHEKQTSIIPIPGRTIIDGRRFPSALEVLSPTQLAIIPIERAQPPLFVERSLEHNFFAFVGPVLNTGLLTVRQLWSDVIPSTRRRYLRMELQQKIETAIVNGKEGQNVILNIRIMGIEGELRDHLLVMKYTAVPADAEAERHQKTLQTLVDSFRPLRIFNADEKRREIATLADENFKELLAKNGEEIFWAELRLLLLRLQGVNLDESGARLQAMNSLKPFEVFAREINLHEDELDAFWEGLRKAEAGDAADFKADLTDLLQAAIGEAEKNGAEQARLPPVAEREPEEPGSPSGQAALS